MSNRRKARPGVGKPRDHGWLNDLLAPLDGARIPGGCDDCDAYQIVVATAGGMRGVSAIQIYHDDWCPTLAVMS
jgi:hypothetical protein